ncbi:MAG: hypothetical protein ACQETH_13760 [Candidatus Rifleibacteriota bacterium]
MADKRARSRLLRRFTPRNDAIKRLGVRYILFWNYSLTNVGFTGILKKMGNNLIKRLKIFAILYIVLVVSSSLVFAEADPANIYLQKQLSVISKFDYLQNNQTSAITPVIRNFISINLSSQKNQTSEQKGKSLENFLKAAFLAEYTGDKKPILKVLELSGKFAYKLSTKQNQAQILKPFTHHLKEAIRINKRRSGYYAGLSNRETKGLSKLFTTFEYCLLPVSNIFDKWARHYWKKGIPVLKNDFVSMKNIPDKAAPLSKTGSLNSTGKSYFKKVLKTYQSNVLKAAAEKDFIKVQLESIKALSALRKLQNYQNCNLSMSIHFIESIGLAARNADIYSQKFNHESDNFYRAFIISQAVGIRFFSLIDLKAQKFHRQNIGIITNDLPAIPFP